MVIPSPVKIRRIDEADICQTRRFTTEDYGENKNRHREIFLKAQEKFRERAIEELDRMLSDAREGRRVKIHLGLPEPEGHTDDYDRAITMLEMETRETIEIEEADFAVYVMDQWRWKQAWTTNTLNYLAAT